MELHRKLGIATLILGILVTIWRLGKRDRLGYQGRGLTLLAMLAMAGTLAYGAHLGGRVVNEFGGGGTFNGAHSSSGHEDHQHRH